MKRKEALDILKNAQEKILCNSRTMRVLKKQLAYLYIYLP